MARATHLLLSTLAAALAASPVAAQILDHPVTANQSVGPGVAARSGVPSIVGDAPVSRPRAATLRGDDAASDMRCQQDGNGRVAVRAADGTVRCVDRGQVGRLR